MFLGPILIIVLIYFIFNTNQVSPISHRTEVQKTPLQILNERYANGEIEEEEYKRKKRVLNS